MVSYLVLGDFDSINLCSSEQDRKKEGRDDHGKSCAQTSDEYARMSCPSTFSSLNAADIWHRRFTALDTNAAVLTEFCADEQTAATENNVSVPCHSKPPRIVQDENNDVSSP